MEQIIRYALLKPEKLEFYKDLHRNTWPHVKEILAQCKISQYDLYFYKNIAISRLVYEGSNFAQDVQILDTDPEYQHWTALTDPCFLKQDPREPSWKDVDHIPIL